MGAWTYSEIPETELKVILAVYRPRCHLCGARLTPTNAGYIRIGQAVELALCGQCLRDYVEYVSEVVKAAVAADG
ncbi:hypothetical protein [Pyrobaculum neutrophilum]|uniref:Uncharacterized protein n=1 Tax=Pyrobaculum neutrophilum (strain DSM 2338 / JCM 9278 / NBRC 100436 / V24Sta) TaxID=444157 RepID=B1YCN0_PYRNV|nr:hypothetical protein [Pyrobaculum neutrophilum]ACB39543.1 conserved hypothetical protein [Pyrobaculum neutrophilum V24Sta]